MGATAWTRYSLMVKIPLSDKFGLRALQNGQLSALYWLEVAKIREPVLQSYTNSPGLTTRPPKLWDDGILDPVDTRNALYSPRGVLTDSAPRYESKPDQLSAHYVRV